MTCPNTNDLHGFYLEELEAGMTASYEKSITEADIVIFADVSGDINPVHVNHEFAATTLFGETIAHGMLIASLISTVLGTKLPGPGSIYLKQDLSFRAPVKPGDTVVARATVKHVDLGRQRVHLDCQCAVGEKLVVAGEAIMRVDRKNVPQPDAPEPHVAEVE